MEKRVPTAEKVNAMVKIEKVYVGAEEKSGVILWTGTATTVDGVATFYLTDDGLASGNAIFANVFSIQASAEKNTADAKAAPFASIKSLSADRKTLSVNAVVSNTEGGSFAPDGTKVYVLVIGD